MSKAIPQAEPGIDMESLFNKLSFVPHSQAQHEYCFSNKRFNVPCCGRRWGKTEATAHRLTYKSFIPDSYNWIIAPKYALGEKEFRIVYSDYQKLDILRHCRKSYSIKQGDMRIQTPWNSVIQVVSAEKPDSLLGEGLSHAVMSEAAQHNRQVWEQYIEPALSDLLGTCDFPSTPKGFNWYHGLWLLGQENHPNFTSSNHPTWTNPIRYPGGWTNAEIVRIRATTSKTYFDQEYGAKFTSLAGAIYEEWDPNVHVKQHQYQSAWPNFLAFDYGFVNPFVCLDIQVAPDDTVYVWREYYGRYLSTFEHGQAITSRDQPENYHIDGMWGDPRGPDEAATLALIPNLGHVASAVTPWKSSVEMLKRLLKLGSDGYPKLYVDPSCVNLIRQMGTLRVKELKRTQTDLQEHQGDGNIQHKTDDHAADALRYFIGPYFVLGANSHLEDVYGQSWLTSESNDFFTLHSSPSLDVDNEFSRAVAGF